jgi:hypothetical protein
MVEAHIEADVPESRQVTITLPPEAPTGRVWLTIQVEPDGSGVAADEEAFRRYLPQLQTRTGKYAGIYQRVVWAVGDSREEVERQMRERFGAVPVFVGWVPPAEVARSGVVTVHEAGPPA